MIMKECAVSQHRLAPPLTCLGSHGDADADARLRYSCISRMLRLLSLAADPSDKPSAEVVCFSSACRSPGTPPRAAMLYQLSDARGKLGASRSPLAPRRDDVCVCSHQVASLHVAGWRRELPASSPHYSFCKLIRPAMISAISWPISE